MAIQAAFVVPHPPLLVPEVGRGDEKRVAATLNAMREVACQVAELQPDLLIIVSPHAPYFGERFFIDTREGEVADSFAGFGAATPRIRYRPDKDFAERLLANGRARGLDFITAQEAQVQAERPDHGSLVPLYFIARAAQPSSWNETAVLRLPFPVLRLSFSTFDAQTHFEYGKTIAATCQETGKKAVFIASGDLSHKLKEDGPYGFATEGPQFDEAVCEILQSGDLKRFFALDESFCEAAAECGLRSFEILSGALNEGQWQADLLSYEGPFGVGYAVASFLPQEEMPMSREANNESEHPYPALARCTLEAFVRHGAAPELSAEERKNLGEANERQAGVFVSLHKDGELRGCIGTISSTTPSVVDEIMQNAVSAGTEDPRFAPVQAEELPYLEYSVDVLAEAEAVQDTSGLDAQRYGVIVSRGWKRGLLLPALEGVDSVAEQLRIACLKAGIDPQGTYHIERFEVLRYPGLAPRSEV